ncbi:MAG: signal peptidase I [Microthrixaceae bacterium]
MSTTPVDTIRVVRAPVHLRRVHRRPAVTEGRSFLVARAGARTYLWFCATMVAWLLVPTLFGWSPMVVSSASMSPALSVGDVVMVDRSGAEAAEEGSIVAVKTPESAEPVTHRVYSEPGPGSLVTKGDANTVPDPEVPTTDVMGRARLVVPFSGWPSMWLAGHDWVPLVLLGAGTLVALGVVATGLGASGHPRSVMGVVVLFVVGALIGAVLGPGSVNAAFSGSTGGSALLGADTPLRLPYPSLVGLTSPTAYWRLGEPTDDGVRLVDDFESFTGWSQIGAGTVSPSTAQAHSGTGSLHKGASTDPRGGTKMLSEPVGDDFKLSVWVYRPTGYPNAAQSLDMVSLEDASGNGYGFEVRHKGNRFRIKRRTGGNAYNARTVSWNPPENQWFRVELVRNGGNLQLRAYDTANTQLVATNVNQNSYHSFDRVTVRGGINYFVDDLEVTTTLTDIAIDQVGAHDAPAVGNPTWQVPGLLIGDPNAAVDLSSGAGFPVPASTPIDGAFSQRSVVAWIDPDALSGRQVIWGQGNTTRGFVIYLQGSQLRARIYSTGSGWGTPLDAMATITPGRHQVAATFDSTAAALVLYVDGVPVDTATGSARSAMASAPNNTAFGTQSANLVFHDGVGVPGAQAYDGVIDEVSLHPGLLSASAIETLYAAGS